MAREPLTSAVIESLPVTPYADIRPELLTGDICVFSGRAWVSRLISRATRSPVSHVGVLVVVPELDRILVAEAVEGFGVRLAPLSRLVWGATADRYNGAALVLRHLTPVTQDGLIAAARWGFDELARPYAYRTLFRIGLRILFGWRRDPQENAWVCSQFTARWLELAGLDLDAPPYDITTPADLFRDPHFELIARIA